jgi:murein DD-endopeptidase MepM/ murein hydrolase activator NlpD
VSRTTARHRKPDQRSSGRPSAAPQRSSSGSSVARQHRKSSPIVSVLQNKPARAAAAAVAASALLVAAWPTASHWLAELPHASGAGQADALGVAPVGAHRSPAHQPAAADIYASGQPAATLGEFVSQEPEIVSVAVASRPGRHRKPSQTGQTGQQAPAASGYLNPLRAVSGLVPERVDQGVDFAGTGPVYAIGDAVVTGAMGGNSGWPGGGWVSYQLTDGPDAGLVVYVAEDVTPTVQVGQHVSSATVIANMYNGGDGIETGWAAAQTSLTAESQMPEAGGIGAGGPFPTMVGLSFEGLLQSLGVPASPGAGTSGYGTLPAGYPAA